MTEEERMQNQQSSIVTTWDNVPYGMIADDVEEASKQSYFAEVDEINNLYQIYEQGVDFQTEGSAGDYIPSQIRYKKAASILNKEARFLFSTPPDFNINSEDVNKVKVKKNSVLQDLVKKVLNKSNFNENLMKACKDCFIGKRIAIVVNFNEDSGIKVSFLNSLSFICETDLEDMNKLTKFVFFYNMVNTTNRREQRYFKKTYVLENNICWFTEEIYDGLGTLLETLTGKKRTELNFIPCCVIRNDGLTGDLNGASELGYLIDYEEGYSRLANADVDAERKSMNPVRYTIDASANSTASLPSGPGSYWDLQTDDSKSDESSAAQVGLLEPKMAYSSALKITLDRIENAMYSEVDVPNINNEKLQGVITSGKTISALYWGLAVRCDEKMLAWSVGLSFIAMAIIEGAKKYPNIAKRYISDKIPDIVYDIEVVNNYALPEDEQEEKEMDITEVTAQVMSRKAYMKKWRKMSDEDAEEELMQIKREQMLFEDSEVTYPDANDEQDEDSYEDSLDNPNLNEMIEDDEIIQ